MNSSFTSGIKNLSPRLIIGFALCHCWALSSAINVVTPRFAEIGVDDSLFQLLYTSTLLIVGAYLLICAILYKQVAKFIYNKFVLLVAGTLVFFGTFFIGVVGTNDAFGLSFLLLSSLFMGVGGGTLVFAWGQLFSRMLPEQATLNSVLAFSLALIACVLIGFLPAFPRMLVISLLILLSAIFLVQLETSDFVEEQRSKAEAQLFIHKGRFALHLGSAALLYGVPIGALRNLYLNSVVVDRISSDALMLIIVALLVVILSIFIGVALLNRSDYWFLHRQVTIVVASAVLAIPFLGLDSGLLSYFILPIGLLSFELFLWVLLAETSFNFRLPALFVFGIGSSMFAFGNIFGTWLSGALLKSESILARYDALGALLAIFCILLGFCLLPREKDVIHFAIEDETDTTKDVEIGKNHFTARCEKVASDCLLSERETEVFSLLAKGRTSSYIQKELYISKGTAKNHIWHIYRKLNIHTQQELIDLVDSISD